LALLCDKPPSGLQWIHEIKYDGYRIQARLDGGRVRLLTRKRLDWTKRFPTIASALEGLSVSSALIDGEIVAEDERGIPSFSLLQADLKASRHDRLRYYAFDLLYLDGFDLTDASLLDRKSLLQQALSLLPSGSPLSIGVQIFARRMTARHPDTDETVILVRCADRRSKEKAMHDRFSQRACASMKPRCRIWRAPPERSSPKNVVPTFRLSH